MKNLVFINLLLLVIGCKSQSLIFDTLIVYGSKYPIEKIKYFKTRDGQDSAIINCSAKTRKMILLDRHANDCAVQAGAQKFSLYDVLSVSGSMLKFKWIELFRVLDKIHFDTSNTNISDIFIKIDNIMIPVTEIKFRILSYAAHVEYLLFAPKDNIRLSYLIGSLNRHTKVILDSMSFSLKDGYYHLPYEIVMLP